MSLGSFSDSVFQMFLMVSGTEQVITPFITNYTVQIIYYLSSSRSVISSPAGRSSDEGARTPLPPSPHSLSLSLALFFREPDHSILLTNDSWHVPGNVDKCGMTDTSGGASLWEEPKAANTGGQRKRRFHVSKASRCWMGILSRAF